MIKKQFTFDSSVLDSSNKQNIVDDRGAVVDVYKYFLSKGEAKELFENLMKGLDWQNEVVRLNDTVVEAPRLVAVLGPEGTHYRYSGSIKTASGWHFMVEEMKERLRKEFGQDYNFALCNLYRDGNDSIGLHADAEEDIVEDSIIASLSLGATRDFILQNKQTEEIKKVSLPSGSLLLMMGKTQKLYRHEVQKDISVKEPRINITFRLVHNNLKSPQEDPNIISMVTSKPSDTKVQVNKAPANASKRGGKSRIQGRGALNSRPPR
eukprot:TRINITY_DN8728_c0_g1_i1.p1 TRINITY_DN8728_c0_g1~~TRINITY_DN8728_c0_g1_i1.p1  ORF type:complete len:265 (+),score=36.75 TRINITY_DN8728_c0_g1_i1:139-933(+)